jgi:polyhydroxybutyrate depolymerase
MAYHAACELDAQVAAVAVVAGSIVDGQCAPRRPVPLVAFHGTADDEVSYRDSSFATAAGPPPRGTSELPPSIRFWATIDHCGDARTTPFAENVLVTRFARCAADVVLYTIQGGTHEWPRASLDSDDPAHEVDASRQAWRFFSRHPLP